jgi:ankyrin repeat protein
VEYGADPAQRDRFGETPLDLALAYKNANAVAALLKLGEQRKQLKSIAQEAMEDATVRGYSDIALQLRDSSRHTALDRARETENAEAIRLLTARLPSDNTN